MGFRVGYFGGHHDGWAAVASMGPIYVLSGGSAV